MMVEAEATERTIELIKGGAPTPTEEVVAQGLDAAKPFIKILCDAQAKLAKVAAKPTAEFPVFLDYQDDVFAAVEKAAKDDLAKALTIVGKQERETKIDEISASVKESVSAQFEGREKEVPAAFRSLTKKLVRQRVLRDKIRIDGRGLRDIRALSAEVEVIRAWRDTDSWNHNTQHVEDGAAARYFESRKSQALHAQLQLPTIFNW
jgi:polyribonucleotide nucleotidyltransferase